jgi:hypothetical protein
LKFSILVDLSVVTVFPNFSAVGSWEEVLLFSMDFTVSQISLELVLHDANFCLKKLALAFLTDCVYWFLTSLKSCISRGLFNLSFSSPLSFSILTLSISLFSLSLSLVSPLPLYLSESGF